MTRNNKIKTKDSKVTWGIIGIVLLIITFLMTDGTLIYKIVNTTDMFIYILWATFILYIYIFFVTKKINNEMKYGRTNIKTEEGVEVTDKEINDMRNSVRKAFKSISLKMFLLIPFQLYIAYELVSVIPNNMYSFELNSYAILLLILNTLSLSYFIYKPFKEKKKV
jgi:hypothetical protein